MTLRKPSAPNQVKQIQNLTKLINATAYVFITDNEIHSGQKVLEAEWMPRVEEFLDDPISGIPNTEYDRMYTVALLARRYSNHLDKALVEKLTRCLKDPVPPEGTKEQRLAKTKKRLGLVTK